MGCLTKGRGENQLSEDLGKGQVLVKFLKTRVLMGLKENRAVSKGWLPAGTEEWTQGPVSLKPQS